MFSAAQLLRVHLLALLTPAHSFNLLIGLIAEHRTWRTFAHLRNRRVQPDVRMLHEFRQRLNLAKLRGLNEHLLAPLLEGGTGFAKTVALIDATDLPAATNAYKNSLGQYSAHRANTGARSRKEGQSRYFIGYKKHTLRLWLRQHRACVLLAPLISWAAPANRDDSVFLEPSIDYCARHLNWTPDIVVGDMAYGDLRTQRRLRENRHVALVTKLKPNMVLPEEFEN